MITFAQASALTPNLVGHQAQVEALIPSVEEKLLGLCNQTFGDRSLYLGWNELTGLVFDASGKTITGSQFVTCGFAAGQSIIVRGTLSNDGVYAIKTVTETVIAVEDIYTLADETNPNFTSIDVIRLPKALVPILARMLEWEVLFKPKLNPGLQSESIGSYNYSRGDAYPAEIIQDIIAAGAKKAAFA